MLFPDNQDPVSQVKNELISINFGKDLSKLSHNRALSTI